jgi:predicted RNA-binding protein with PIN domain
MELLIDTWNVLHQQGVLPPDLAGLEVGNLAVLLSKGRWSRDRIALICDGTPQGSDAIASSRNTEIIYTGGNKTADREIMDRVAASSSANRIVVVTNDREIIRFIRAKGSQHLGSVEFLEAVIDDHQRPSHKIIRKPSGLTPEKADAWKEEFGFDVSKIDDLHDEILDTEVPTRIETPQEKPALKKTLKKATPPKPELSIEYEFPDDLIDKARKLADE